MFRFSETLQQVATSCPLHPAARPRNIEVSIFGTPLSCFSCWIVETHSSYHWRVPVFVVVNGRTFASYEVSASVAEDFIFLGFDASSAGNRILTFRGNVVTSSSRIDFCFYISTLEDETINLLWNVGIWWPIEAVLYSKNGVLDGTFHYELKDW